MKKGFFCFMLFVFVIVLVIGCNKNSAPFSPLSVNVLKPTPTNTATPDVKFSVFLMQEATPVASVQVKMAPQGVTTQAACFTDETGKAEFEVHSGGNWDVIIPSNDGFENMYYSVEPMSNTVLAIDRGAQTLEMVLVSGSLSLPIQANEQVFMITYHTAVSKLYNLEILGVPQGVSVSATSTQVKNDGDKVFFTLYYPNSFEGFDDSFDLSIRGSAAEGNSVIQSNINNITKVWCFNVKADIKMLKLWILSGDVDYYLAVNNYNYTCTDSAVGVISSSVSGHNIWGDLPGIGNSEYFEGNLPEGEGNYKNIVKINASNGGYAYCKDHDGVYGSITIRFTDSNVLDVRRTFVVDSGFGELCGEFSQICWTYASSLYKCGNWPNQTGCSYTPIKLKKSKSETVWGEK
ncbi:MAG: hypothetical protein CVV21_10920 [Candidatus Goldiibacteriota bacterium HGW-Goldbacteria-1]|jgi:hypothetical protein|nr:MAG: hypothetical protein CVV21_10920 [Candidatus Goldiibacteriota bacterium HGW-Goldbacteria-1]